jgi:tRNA modification GTPase
VLRARELVISSSEDELIAAELRTALESLGEVVGAVYTDDVLDRVFARFCIGK